MCLAVPEKITAITEQTPLCLANVDFGGLTKSIALTLTPQAQVGDYVLVHAGFAISIIDEANANALIQVLNNEIPD